MRFVMSVPSILDVAWRRASPAVWFVVQAVVALLLLARRPYAATAVACIGEAGLAVAAAAAGRRTRRVRLERDTATRRVGALEAAMAEADTDPVTGLPVRRVAERYLASMVGSELTVAIADVDDMHGINNGHDHQFGDEYLAAVAIRLAGIAADGDLVARLGGDEFVIFTTRSQAVLATAIGDALRHPVLVRGVPVSQRLSVGIGTADSGDPYTGLGHADRAMYTAKRRRSGIELYDPVRDGIPPARAVRPCACRKCHPGRSSGMFVLVQHSAEAVASVDGQVGEPVRVGDRFGQRGEWSGVGDALVRTMLVIEDLKLAQHVQ
jgi:diguanylate cyclase (GGDEF)-like protein